MAENNVDESKNPKPAKVVVVVKNYPMRNRVASIFSLPFLVLASAIFSVPLLLFGKLGLSAALTLTVVSEIIIVILALNYIDQLKNWAKKLRLNNFKWSNVFIGIGFGSVMYFLLQGLAIGMNYLGMPIVSSDTSVAITSSTGLSYVIASFILAPFIVPFVEELFFRGYVLGFFYDSFEVKEKMLKESKKKIKNIKKQEKDDSEKFDEESNSIVFTEEELKNKSRKNWAVFWSLLVSSIVFSLAHFQGLSDSTDIFLLIWIAFMACVNGILFLKTKSIYTSFFLHMTYNGLTLLVPLLLG